MIDEYMWILVRVCPNFGHNSGSQFRQKDSQKGKGNGCFKCGSTDHVAKDCVGGNPSSKFIVKDQNRQHGGGEGYDMVFEGDLPEIPKRKQSHDRDERERREKIRKRSPPGDDGRRQHHREDSREIERKQRKRKERESREDEERRRGRRRDIDNDHSHRDYRDNDH